VSVAGLLREGWAGLAAAVLPLECGGCREPGAALCRRCAVALDGPGHPAAPPPAPGCPPVWVAADYAGATRSAVVAWKDRGRHDLAGPLAAALGAATAAALLDPDLGVDLGGDLGPRQGGVLLVPVPSGRRAVRRRGEDVVADLARRAAAALRGVGLDVAAAPVLRPARRVRDQAGLGAADRAANLAGAFRTARTARVAGRCCLVVDDVVTTGSTVAEAARVLRSAGASVPAAAAVAATRRRRGSRVSDPAGLD